VPENGWKTAQMPKDATPLRGCRNANRTRAMPISMLASGDQPKRLRQTSPGHGVTVPP